MITSVILAECPNCKTETECALLDCMWCYERYLEKGGDPDKYTDIDCPHLECLTCEERFGD